MTALIAKSASSATLAFAALGAAFRRLARLPEALAELIEKHAIGK
jgi:hypothetical protein